jgi:hypothetical protein
MANPYRHHKKTRNQGLRPIGLGSPRERHFGFSGKSLTKSAANDNPQTFYQIISKHLSWLIPGVAAAVLIFAVMA